MKRIAFILFILIASVHTFAQVETRYFLKGDTIVSDVHKMIRQSKAAKVKVMPAFDLEKLRKEDDEMKGEDAPYRFGKGFDVSYTLSDGKWEYVEGGRLWSLSFESKDALSLNYIFDDFYLPDGASLYVENEDKTVLYGPVTSDMIIQKRSTFLTDVIAGEQSTIYLYEPENHINESKLTIKRVVHGYRGTYVDKNYGTVGASSSCNIDVACYPYYENESNAVGLTLLASGTEWCSGAMLMDTEYSFKPYFLTAFHCIDTSPRNFELSVEEKTTAENWMFKFCFKKTTCNGNVLATSYTYNKADFCSAWNTTDFALLKIKGAVSQNTALTWLGWDKRDNVTPTSGIGIHHPAGDVMKISIEEDQVSTDYVPTISNCLWKVDYDYGIVQGGSSGSPLLNQDKRVVGQLYGCIEYTNPCYQTECVYGKFHESWSGGGSDSTRLSNWLDPDFINVNTMDGQQYLGEIYIVGDSVINYSSQSFSLANLPSGLTVVWSITDPYYQSVIQQNTPGANQCAIVGNTSHEMLNQTLTATIKHNGHTIRTINKIVSTKEQFFGTYYNGQTTMQINYPNPLNVLPGTNVNINSSNLIGASVSYTGSVTPYLWQFNSTTGNLKVGMPSSGGNTIVVHAVSALGTDFYLPIIRTSVLYSLSLNVGNGQIEVELIPEYYEEELQDLKTISDRSVTEKWTIEVYNARTGEKVLVQEVEGNNYTFDTTGWESGIYIVRVTIGDEVLSEKVVVK